jgi:hypothetical protein
MAEQNRESSGFIFDDAQSFVFKRILHQNAAPLTLVSSKHGAKAPIYSREIELSCQSQRK